MSGRAGGVSGWEVSMPVRRAGLMAVVGVLLLSLTSPATSAGLQPPRVNPKPASFMAAGPYAAGGLRVEVAAFDRWSGPGHWSQARVVCVAAERVEPVFPGVRRVTTHAGCMEHPGTYEADAVEWRGRVVAEMSVEDWYRHEHFNGSSWQTVDVHKTGESQVGITLDWTSSGPPEPSLAVNGFPLGCYSLPPICTTVHAALERPAAVTGTIRLEGPGVALNLDGHPGRMSFSG